MTKASSTGLYYLYNFKRIRRYLSRENMETLIHAFIPCRLDYCNSLMYELPACQLAKLQREQNATARLIFNESRCCHITLLLHSLHWLPIKYRTDLKIQARRLVFDRVGSFSVETDQTGVVQTFSLSTGLLVHIICGTRNTIKHCMASYLKSCRHGKAADLGDFRVPRVCFPAQGPRNGLWKKE